MQKLMDSFKTYEHVLSEDSVMDHFKNIINKAKKFAKPELKACIEEFEEKINKFHIEKKELEITAKNAEVHQQKVQILENIRVSKEDGEESKGSETSGDSEVSGPSTEVTTVSSSYVPKTKFVESEQNSHASSEVIECEAGDNEVQSPKAYSRGVSKSPVKKISMKDQKGDSQVSTRRSTRSRGR